MNPAMVRARFARLLDAYSALAMGSRASIGLSTTQIRALLERFVQLREIADREEQTNAIGAHKCFHNLLVGYNATLERYRQQQEHVADDFNLLDVMRVTGNEIRHSMTLAWLLDRDMHKLGTHAQGSLGFRLFLSEFGLPLNYADCKYWVRREVAGNESIVDIEVACRGQFLIHVENKIWSSEGTDQTDREWSDLQRRSAELKVSKPEIHALFLSPHGSKPANPMFCPILWGRVVRVLEKFSVEAKPVDVRLFARHYARALRRFIVIQDIGEDDNAETTDERS